MMVAPQPESSARCPARRPIFMDFSCGAHSPLPSGTRSRVWRVLIISWSNSARMASRIGMVFLLLVLLGMLILTQGINEGQKERWRKAAPLKKGRPARDVKE